MKHVCPACGKEWECACPRDVKLQHIKKLGDHPEEIGCSEKCAKQLRALVTFLARYGR